MYRQRHSAENICNLKNTDSIQQNLTEYKKSTEENI